MNFIEDILKGKTFLAKSTQRRKATMITLFMILSALWLSFDLVESIRYGYSNILVIETGAILILLAAYVFFPYVSSLEQTIYIVLFTVIVFLLLSLFFDDMNQELTLFYIATIPIYIFYFFGLSQGKIWSLIVFGILLLITFISYMQWISVFYSSTFMLQISAGYALVSYWLYLIESERDASKDDLLTALNAKEVLFKEVHHRTKNNMQVMMGLLETQSFKIKEPRYKKMFQAHVDRIKAMSFVHENLYSNENYEKVDMHKYLNELSDSLQKLTPHTIITDIDFVFLGIKTSMNVGLIFNEAISNAIEHAYNVGVGYIDVSLKRIGNQCILSIKDYGQGFNATKTYQTLGMTLIEDLSHSLPNGSLSIKVENGTQINVYFDIKELD